jgi:hypothetical protein
MSGWDFPRVSGMVRAGFAGAALYSIPYFIPGLELRPAILVLLFGLGGVLAAVLAVVISGHGLGVGGGPILGVLTAGCGSVLLTLGSFFLVSGGHNPIGQKLALVWSWGLANFGWAMPGAAALSLRGNLHWLEQGFLDISVVSCIAVYSFFAAVLPTAAGSTLGALLMGFSLGERKAPRESRV